MNPTTSLFTLSILALVACSSSPSPSPSGPPEPTPAAEPACPAPHGPTFHTGAIPADEVWTADGSPHVITGNVSVREGRTLTIEPCSVVELEHDTNLTIAFPGTPTHGALVAEGTAARPIAFRGTGWNRILVDGGGTAKLAHVTIEGGGADGDGALAIFGLREMPVQRGTRVDHVAVHGGGVKIGGVAAFADGSTDLTITGAPGFPLEANEYAIGSIPDGAYTGNGIDEIAIVSEGAIEESMTMRPLGVPYRATKGLRIGRGVDAPLAVLTIDAGTTVRFGKASGLEIEHLTGEPAASGALVVNGSADRPVVMTSSEATPAPGDWKGLWFGGSIRTENRVANLRLEYTGADCGCVLSSCSALTTNDGAVIFTHPPPSLFFTDSTIAHGKSHGFVLGYTGPRLDFAGANRFEDIAGCPMTLPSEASCPSPKPACE